MIKNRKIDLQDFKFMDYFYDPQYEQDANVRHMWFVFIFFFLPKINKDWKENLQPSRLRKKTFIYDHITTSDEAMTRWFLKIWEPKIKDQFEKGWPHVGKSYGDGEQELRKGLKDYVAIHQKVSDCKMSEAGKLAIRWNDIFWEEMIKHNPSAFDEDVSNQSTILESTIFNTTTETVVLPDMDDDEGFLQILKNKKSIDSVEASNNKVVIPTSSTDALNSSNESDIHSAAFVLRNHFGENKVLDEDLIGNELAIESHPI